MKSLLRSCAALFILLSQFAVASEAAPALTQFFAMRLSGISDEITVTVRSPDAMLPACEQPEYSMPGNARLWGNLSVVARCGNQKRYIQVTVQATGNYVVATQSIPRGMPLDENSVTLKRGRLDQLPPRAMLDINQARDAVTLRDLAAGQTVLQSMVRQAWRVKAGQNVMVVASGEGFSVNSEGKALNNAAIAQSARVRMASGQIVSGTVDPDGNILINL